MYICYNSNPHACNIYGLLILSNIVHLGIEDVTKGYYKRIYDCLYTLSNSLPLPITFRRLSPG